MNTYAKSNEITEAIISKIAVDYPDSAWPRATGVLQAHLNLVLSSMMTMVDDKWNIKDVRDQMSFLLRTIEHESK